MCLLLIQYFLKKKTLSIRSWKTAIAQKHDTKVEYGAHYCLDDERMGIFKVIK